MDRGINWCKIIRGTVRKCYSPCGKKNCICKKGKLHGPYYYFLVSENGKTEVRYIPSNVTKEKIIEGIKNYNKLWDYICRISRKNLELLFKQKIGVEK